MLLLLLLLSRRSFSIVNGELVRKNIYLLKSTRRELTTALCKHVNQFIFIVKSDHPDSHGKQWSYAGSQFNLDQSNTRSFTKSDMPSLDIKADSINNYFTEFLREIDDCFLNPEFNTYAMHSCS